MKLGNWLFDKVGWDPESWLHNVLIDFRHRPLVMWSLVLSMLGVLLSCLSLYMSLK